MLCSPPPATTLASSCAGSQGFCAPCYRRSSQRSRIHNRPKTGRTLLLHERLFSCSRPVASSRRATIGCRKVEKVEKSSVTKTRQTAIRRNIAAQHHLRPVEDAARCPIDKLAGPPS